MGAKGGHPRRALSETRIHAPLVPGRYADGNCLYLVVDPSGAKRWLLRTIVRGRRCDLGLGGLSLVSLTEARERVATLRKQARDGGDPLAARRHSRATIPTFEEAARLVHAEHSMAWKNQKHRAQWMRTLENDVFPVLGTRPVDQIETPEVLTVLAPIWLAKPETARRIRQRIGLVLDWSRAAGYRVGETPVTGLAQVLPKQLKGKRHFAALPYQDICGFIEDLRSSKTDRSTKLAFEFLILTAARTKEVVGAKWSEVDLASNVWTLPEGRMKGGRPHAVPLSARCLDILRHAHDLSNGGELIFTGRTAGKPVSSMAFLTTLRRIQKGVTVHGFRSTFRDWASERTNFPREVCDMALAHAVRERPKPPTGAATCLKSGASS